MCVCVVSVRSAIWELKSKIICWISSLGYDMSACFFLYCPGKFVKETKLEKKAKILNWSYDVATIKLISCNCSWGIIENMCYYYYFYYFYGVNMTWIEKVMEFLGKQFMAFEGYCRMSWRKLFGILGQWECFLFFSRDKTILLKLIDNWNFYNIYNMYF